MKSLGLLVFALAACGGGAHPTTTTTATPPPPAGSDAGSGAAPAAGSDDGGKVVGPPEVAWKDMSDKQRGHFMAKVVMPKFQPLFQQFDGKMFKEFGCKTCHEKGGVEKHKFDMPNPDIYVLPEAPEDFGKIMKQKPEWMKLMGQVEEEMAGTLGLPPYNPKAPDPSQFGCFGCHTHKPGGAGDL